MVDLLRADYTPFSKAPAKNTKMRRPTGAESAILIMARPRVPGARLCAPSTSRSASELPKACGLALALQPFDRAAAGPADTAALRPCTGFIMRIAGAESF